ncbi:MAG: colicin E3/pyocin S6 family cytotoxin, partial [Alphaproteobacteria bacterium]|nr:colicin E3/pyocin S6 family cytotoxin [Alphaproteobacteria bacterium]
RREVELAHEGWRKGDASLLPDMVWSQPAARDMMERQMGYPFGRPDLAPSAVIQLESPLPTRAHQACGGMDIPVPGKPDPMITPMPAPRLPEPMVTPEVRGPSVHELAERFERPPVVSGSMEGFTVHPSISIGPVTLTADDTSYVQPRVHPAPELLEAFPEAIIAPKRKTPVKGGGGLRKRWKDRKHIYEWDAENGRVEKYNKRGEHLGEFDHITGEKTKEADPTRRIES